MINLLYILGIWGNGGIEKVISNYCFNLDREKFNITILPIEKRDSVFTEDLSDLGIRILHPFRIVSGNPMRKFLLRERIIENAIKEGDYDIVHYHNSSAVSYLYIAKIKKKYPHIKVILHSHGDDAEAPFVYAKRFFNIICKEYYKKFPNYYVACSESAGKWLFSRDILLGKRYSVLPNAFDTKEYVFDIKKRKRIREELGIGSSVLIGTIGRFCYQKNPDFVFNIIKSLNDRGELFKFLWIGEGRDRDRIIKRIDDCRISENILFVDSSNDIPGMLSAMDAFILPSRYEGLGLVLLEAQCSGLPCYASDTIPRNSKISDSIKYLPITNADLWAKTIQHDIQAGFISAQNIGNEFEMRMYPEKELINSNFDNRTLMENLNVIYELLINEREDNR